jgi:hypothetical protein
MPEHDQSDFSLTVTVPGSLWGLEGALHRFGTMTRMRRKQLLAGSPIVERARRGCGKTRSQMRQLGSNIRGMGACSLGTQARTACRNARRRRSRSPASRCRPEREGSSRLALSSVLVRNWLLAIHDLSVANRYPTIRRRMLMASGIRRLASVEDAFVFPTLDPLQLVRCIAGHEGTGEKCGQMSIMVDVEPAIQSDAPIRQC